MKILEVFDKGRTDHSLKPLDPTELTDLEALLHEKNSRLYFRCPVRRKDILAKPEEAVRQLWILRLTNQYAIIPLTYVIGRLYLDASVTWMTEGHGRLASTCVGLACRRSGPA